MKFNKGLTATRSPFEGVAAYEEAITAGELRRIVFSPTRERARLPHWQVNSIAHHAEYWTNESAEPVEVMGMVIPPRTLVIDELTRHRGTRQLFVPVTSPFLAIVAQGLPDDPDSPDPDTLTAVPVSPGEVFEVGVSTWHTLPLAFSHPVAALSVVHKEPPGAYHDVRDVTAAGWVGFLVLDDPAALDH